MWRDKYKYSVLQWQDGMINVAIRLLFQDVFFFTLVHISPGNSGEGNASKIRKQIAS